MRKVFSLLLALMLIVSLAVPAVASSTDKSAGAGTVNLQRSKKITITPDVGSLTDTDLFGNFKGVMPGDKKTENIVIKNWALQYDYVKVYMEARKHPAEDLIIEKYGLDKEENVDFLSQLKMTVWNGDKVIYEAAPGTSVELDDEGKLSEPVYLGKLNRLGKLDLDVLLEVPIALDNDYTDAMGEVDWVFYFEGHNHPSSNPKTGDYIIMGALALLVLSAAALLILFLAKRRKNRK